MYADYGAAPLPEEYYYASPDTNYEAPPPGDADLYGTPSARPDTGIGAQAVYADTPEPAFAATPLMRPHAADRGRLMDLARKFVATIGKDIQNANEQLAKLDEGDMRLNASFDAIPDGETLILDVALTRSAAFGNGKIRLPQPVTAVKQGHDLMISLAEFFSAVIFPIKVHGDEGKADGWFVRQTQPFHLDMNAKQVTAGKKTFTLSADDAIAKDGDILVRGRTLALWFGFQMKTNIQGQYVDLKTYQEWPPQEKEDRERRASLRLRRQPPQLPFFADPYRKAEVPSVDVALSTILARPAHGRMQRLASYTVQSAGDLAGFSMRSLVSGANRDMLGRATVTLSRQSEKPDLLGPLHAKFYEFNDIQTVNVPSAGDAPQERGIHVTNADPYTTFDTSTQITGTAPAGWDVELYRDLQFVQGATVDPNGRYSFSNVTLFVGENRFRVVSYGPQGEVNEELKTFSVAPGSYGGGFLYDASLSQQNTQTYTSSPPRDKDKGTPHLAANFERQLTDSMILREGFQARKEDGYSTLFVHSGLVKSVGEVLYNADITQSIKGPFTADVTARRNLGAHGLSAGVVYTSRDFQPDTGLPNQHSPGSIAFNAAAEGPLKWHGLTAGSYSFREGLLRDTDGFSTTSTGLTLSSRFKRLYVSNDLAYNTGIVRRDQTRGSNLLGVFSLRGNALGTTWRMNAGYDVLPKPVLSQYNLSLSRQLSPTLGSDLRLTRAIFPKSLSSVNASLDWQKEHATISPTISYDSDNNLSLLMNVRFGIARNPYTKETIVSGRSLNNYGSVAAFVFLDKDGDGVYSKDDEPLPDVTVESVQNQVRVETDKKGEAYLYNLPPSQITDVHVGDTSTLDPDWVPGFAGVSIRPRVGHVTRLNFPIWRGGEMDGTAYIRLAGGATRPLAHTQIYLYDGDGILKMKAVTAPDGYYVFEKIPPAKYYLIAEPADLKDNRAVPALPRKFVFTFAGTMLYGQNLYFDAAGGGDMSVSISPDIKDFVDANPGIREKDGVVTTINLGDYHTRLLATVVWYKLKTMHADLVAGAVPMVKPGELNNSAKTGLHTLRVVLPGVGLKAAYDRCLRISAAGFTCGVEILPKGLPHQAEADEKGAKKKDKT